MASVEIPREMNSSMDEGSVEVKRFVSRPFVVGLGDFLLLNGAFFVGLKLPSIRGSRISMASRW